jgi:hypothetical protein
MQDHTSVYQELICRGSPSEDHRDYDEVLVRVEVVEDAIAAQSPAESFRLQAFDITGKRVGVEFSQGLLDAALVFRRKLIEFFSCWLSDE